jgi:hypothetical protein
MMTAVEQTLLNALVKLEKAGNSMRTANPKPDRPALFARVDELAKQLPCETGQLCCMTCERKVMRRRGCFYRAATWKIRLEIAGTFESESTL